MNCFRVFLLMYILKEIKNAFVIFLYDNIFMALSEICFGI